MISTIELTNFKCFKRLRLPLGSLTLLTGYNAGGKSTVLQSLLLLAQELRRSCSSDSVALNGPLVRLGTAADVVRSGSEQGKVSFEISAGEESWRWDLLARAGERTLHVVGDRSDQRPNSYSIAGQIVDSLRQLVFVSAIRPAPADAFPMPNAGEDWRGNVGSDGSYAAYWYDRCVDEQVPIERCHAAEEATSMRKQLDAWMGALFPGAQANVQLHAQASLANLQFRMSGTGPWQRPANVGYGLTYAFPILVALLTAQEGQIIAIDSPEAHLHPFAQSQMGRILAQFAAAGVQVIVETHSDHLLNGARLAVKQGIIAPDELRIHFFAGVDGESHGVISPAIDAAGRLSEWPEGFFDQGEKDTARLLGWES